ncbi:MAG TPA: ABC transporter permease subunit [Ktedonobacteraceae bacterium]|nr:ABC transporter permease subunit [Ktedonobacteraceae bacterium]
MKMQIVGTPASEIANQKSATPGKVLGKSSFYALTGWLGFLPFFLFCLLFELLPAVMIVESSFIDSAGGFTLNNFQRMFLEPDKLHAFQNSILLSLVSALISAVVGFFAAYGVYNLRTGWVRNLLVGFSSVAANFAGIPLAFAFISTLGVTGYVTVLLLHWFHIDLYNGLNFSLYSFWGLVIAYCYFLLPLMILVTFPALEGLRPEWREAATNLGASRFTYWRKVGLPVLLPSLIDATMLLFANAFAAFATAYALAQGNINLVPIQISFVVNGNVSLDPGLGNAMSVGMILVLVLVVVLYTFMLRRASRWQGR